MKTSSLGFFACFLVAVLTASAQITFTVNGSTTSAALGYTSGQATTFSFVLNDFAPTLPTGSVSVGNFFEWKDDNTATDPAIWTSVTGTGLSGTWTRPVTDGSTAISYIDAYAAGGQLWLMAGTVFGGDTGLTVGGQSFKTLILGASYSGLDFSPVTGALADPSDYFGNHLGSYGASSTNVAVLENGIGGQVHFNISSIVISSIPEPSTYAALTGAFVLGGTFLMRRRRSATQNPKE